MLHFLEEKKNIYLYKSFNIVYLQIVASLDQIIIFCYVVSEAFCPAALLILASHP